jgi:Cdc6-like AAA superfamily ATPase
MWTMREFAIKQQCSRARRALLICRKEAEAAEAPAKPSSHKTKHVRSVAGD